MNRSKKNIIKNMKKSVKKGGFFLNSQPDNPFLNDYKDTIENLKKINKSKAGVDLIIQRNKEAREFLELLKSDRGHIWENHNRERVPGYDIREKSKSPFYCHGVKEYDKPNLGGKNAWLGDYGVCSGYRKKKLHRFDYVGCLSHLKNCYVRVAKSAENKFYKELLPIIKNDPIYNGYLELYPLGYGGKKIKVCLGPNNKYNNDPLTKGQTWMERWLPSGIFGKSGLCPNCQTAYVSPNDVTNTVEFGYTNEPETEYHETFEQTRKEREEEAAWLRD